MPQSSKSYIIAIHPTLQFRKCSLSEELNVGNLYNFTSPSWPREMEHTTCLVLIDKAFRTELFSTSTTRQTLTAILMLADQGKLTRYKFKQINFSISSQLYICLHFLFHSSIEKETRTSSKIFCRKKQVFSFVL